MVSSGDRIARIAFVPLDGDPPADLGLAPLPATDGVIGVVRRAFEPFEASDGDFVRIGADETVTATQSGLLLVYAYGHAWLGDDDILVAPRAGQSEVEASAHLLSRLVPTDAAERTILVLDCCHAAAFDRAWAPRGPPAPRLSVYGSAALESAIALPGDGATRLSLSLAAQLTKRRDVVDFAQVVAEVAETLARDGVIPGQAVSYRMNGPAVRLVGGKGESTPRRERTTVRIRNALLGMGGLVSALLILAGWFYWSHALVDVDLGDLSGVAQNVEVRTFQQDPATNGNRLLLSRRVDGRRIRFWAPASDLILRIGADYRDQSARGLAFHLDLKPDFALSRKAVAVRLPPAREIAAHPDMAYVPPVFWRHGQDLQLRRSDKAFWIDLAPPTVADYLPVAQALNRAGKLREENSFLLTALPRSSAIDAVGLGQVRQLNRDLGDIFGVIDRAQRSTVSAPSDIVVGGGQMPCQRCPAVMTRYEAEVYCASKGKRLPTDLEWELAVRGVDGRLYPWGNRFDQRRANVPGLPDKGQPPPSLKPVDAYKEELSPFGLIDTVGNAGDWVQSDGYSRMYMGANYRFNPEDATAFRELPVTDSDYLVREITARCAVDAGR